VLTTDDSTDGNGNDIEEVMMAESLESRVWEVPEMMADGQRL
jgi:hypothetical protein